MKLAKKKVIAAMRSVSSLETGEYPFQGCKFGEWTNLPKRDGVETPDIPYLALHTDKGTRAIPLGLLYNAQLTDESMTIGELIVDYDDCIQPDADLTGTLVVKALGNRRVELKLQDVSLASMVPASDVGLPTLKNVPFFCLH
jgi:hypothetical protein